MQSKQGKEAGEELEKTVEIDPGFTLAYCQLGHAKLGDRAKAEQALAELKKLHQQELDESSLSMASITRTLKAAYGLIVRGDDGDATHRNSIPLSRRHQTGLVDTAGCRGEHGRVTSRITSPVGICPSPGIIVSTHPIVEIEFQNISSVTGGER